MLIPMSITLDTQTGREADTSIGVHPRLTDTAVERAKTLLNVHDIDGLAKALGFSNRATLWRARVGKTPIRLADARRIAKRLDMPLDEAFEGGDDA
jgi:hypothetical protein